MYRLRAHDVEQDAVELPLLVRDGDLRQRRAVSSLRGEHGQEPGVGGAERPMSAVKSAVQIAVASRCLSPAFCMLYTPCGSEAATGAWSARISSSCARQRSRSRVSSSSSSSATSSVLEAGALRRFRWSKAPPCLCRCILVVRRAVVVGQSRQSGPNFGIHDKYVENDTICPLGAPYPHMMAA